MTTEQTPPNLTQAQSLIWTGQQLHPGVPLYNMVLAYRIAAPIDESLFQSAFTDLVTATDALRTVFRSEGTEVSRVVLDTAPTELEYLDFSTESHPAETYEAWSARTAAQAFDLEQCLYRSALIRLGAEEYVWWLGQHHLITDGWAAAIVYQRMSELYAAALSDEPVDLKAYPSFEFYAEYEHRFRESDSYIAARTYWESKADNSPAPLTFYGREHGPGATTRSQRITVGLGPERSRQMTGIVGDDASLMGGTAEFGLFATTLLACLARISSQDNLAILVPAHNRPSPRFKSTVGLFIEVLPLHVSLDPDETFASLQAKVRATNQELLVNARPGTSSANHNRAYSVLLNFINSSFGDFAGSTMQSEWVHPGHGDNDHALRLQIHDFDETGEYLLHFDLNQDVFDEMRSEAIVRDFLTLLDCLLQAPETTIRSVGLRTPEQQHALDRYNKTSVGLPHATVVAAFRAQAAATPQAIAVSGTEDISYAELAARSDALAGQLLTIAGPRPRVAIHLRRSVDMVVAMLGALKSGGSYVPIDSQYPGERVELLIADSDAAVVLTSEPLAERSQVAVPQLLLPLVDVAGGQLAADPGPDDIAYVMYTSGSTGKPKGVQVTHGNLANYVLWANEVYGRGEPVSFPLYSSFGFDLTVTSLLVPLVSGGTVVVYPEPEGSDLSIRDVFADDRVDVVKMTPSHLSLLEPDLLATSRIRTLILGGEDLKTRVALAAWQASRGRLEIINEYGPTEATVGCMLHRFDPDGDRLASVPIGQPAANARIYVRDHDLGPTPIGVVGELCVAGAGVAAGYLGRPDLTAERFVADPLNPGQRLYRTGDMARWRSTGEVEYLGRADDQVKVRGYRIEIGEIEAALRGHESIAEVVVDVVETETEHTATADDSQCIRCGLTAKHPIAQLNEKGVCQPCLFYDTHADTAEAYFGTMEELAAIFPDDRHRNEAGQDCVMLLSGGKDSTYALYQLVELGLRPLVFTLDNGFISDGAKANIRRAVDDLGLELVMGTTPAMNDIFADSLTQFSNVCQGCFKTVYTMGMNLAHSRDIKHVVTGLSRGQIFETRLADLFRIGITDRDAVDRAIIEARRAYHQVDDAVRRSLDTTLFDDDALFDEIKIVDFYRYQDVGLDVLYEFLGSRAPWVRPGDTGRSTNCLINNTGIYVHTREREFHNYALPYSWDVRLGHKTKEEALAELQDEIDMVQVRGILEQVGYEIQVTDEHASNLRANDHRLVAYYVSRGGDITAGQVRAYLAERLPDHMIPSYLVGLDAIPLTVNGKVDRIALPDPRRHITLSADQYVAPRTEEEGILAQLWESVLGIDRVGINDPFIELGGDSILNIQIVAAAKDLGLTFTPQQLFQQQTIANLATVAASAAPAEVNITSPSLAVSEPVDEAELTPEEMDELMRSFGESS